MNVVWQQTRYDLPVLIRRKQFKQAIGQVTGYVMAGLMLGLITAGFDDDDDDEAKNRKIFQWSTSQFTDTIPVFGAGISDVLETAITGKQPWSRASDILPVASSGASALKNLSQAIFKADGEKAAKALRDAAKTGGYFTGLPVQGVFDAGRLFGVGNDKGFSPETLIGRK
jgi:hypothetical protein